MATKEKPYKVYSAKSERFFKADTLSQAKTRAISISKLKRGKYPNEAILSNKSRSTYMVYKGGKLHYAKIVKPNSTKVGKPSLTHRIKSFFSGTR